MKTYRDEAIVLRNQNLGEADRIVTLLTRRHGKTRSVAKGIRRPKSRFGARLEPAEFVDVQLYRGKTFDHVTEVVTITPYAKGLMRDLSVYAVASAMLEVADRLSPIEGEPAEEQFLLLLGATHALVTHAHDERLVFGSYALRALAAAGWALSVYECAQCGAAPPVGFDVQAGGMVCVDCAGARATYPRSQTVSLLGSLLSGEWQTADAATERVRYEADSLVKAFLRWQMEHDLRALRPMNDFRQSTGPT